MKLIMGFKQNSKMESEYGGNPSFPVQGHVCDRKWINAKGCEGELALRHIQNHYMEKMAPE